MYLLDMYLQLCITVNTVNITVRITVNFDTSHSVPTAENVEC